MTTHSAAADAATTTCSCCGETYPSGEIVRLGCHDDAALCDRCVGWRQFGVPDELPRIKNRRAYLDGLDELPDWRITCFFVDRGERGQGVAATALAGALDEIARLGGGTVESYPDEVEDRKMSASFLHNGTVAMFERQGFERTRRIGKTRWVVRKVLG